MHFSVSLVANAIKVSLPRLGVVLERLLAVVTEVTLRHCSVIHRPRGESGNETSLDSGHLTLKPESETFWNRTVQKKRKTGGEVS